MRVAGGREEEMSGIQGRWGLRMRRRANGLVCGRKRRADGREIGVMRIRRGKDGWGAEEVG